MRALDPMRCSEDINQQTKIKQPQLKHRHEAMAVGMGQISQILRCNSTRSYHEGKDEERESKTTDFEQKTY